MAAKKEGSDIPKTEKTKASLSIKVFFFKGTSDTNENPNNPGEDHATTGRVQGPENSPIKNLGNLAFGLVRSP